MASSSAPVGDADVRFVVLINFAMQARGVTCIALGTNAATLLLNGILSGLGICNLVSVPPLIVQREFAPTDVPRVVALMTAVNQAGFACEPAVLVCFARRPVDMGCWSWSPLPPK